MRKEITLPWTCETSAKIQKVLAWVLLIGFPIMLMFGIYYLHHARLGLLFVIGFFGTALSWIMAWMSDFVTFPTFKCKAKESNIQ